ncbi:MAG: helix-turn-helix domain-containing protein [Desulfovibrio sp.]
MANSLTTIGLRIKDLRTQAELSQQTLAEKADISYKYLGKIERGQVNLSVEVFLKVIKALNVNSEEILSPTETVSSAVQKAKFILSEMSEDELAMALDMLKVIREHGS